MAASIRTRPCGLMVLARLGSGDEAVELFSHAEPGEPQPNDLRRRPLQSGAVGDRRGRLRSVPMPDAEAGVGTRDPLAGGMRRSRKHSWSAAPWGNLRRGSLHPVVVARVAHRLAVPRHPLSDHGIQSDAAMPRCREGHSGRRAGESSSDSSGRRRPHPRCADCARRCHPARPHRPPWELTS